MLEIGNSRVPRSLPVEMSASGNASHGVELAGYVTQLDVYAVPSFNGCCAMVALRDAPTEIVAVLTRDPRFQTVFETALANNKLLTVFGQRLYHQNDPQGNRWADESYLAYRLVLHNAE